MVTKDSYAYYKIAYRANKRYQDKINNDNYGGMLSLEEWENKKEAGLTNSEIVYNQFHFYTKDTAKGIQEALKEQGFTTSIKKIQKQNLPKEIYDVISTTYKKYRAEGKSAKQSQLIISNMFYGSN